MMGQPGILDANSGLLNEILQEVANAEALYGTFTSTHEALGVLLEEFDEVADAIRNNWGESVRREAIQVAAVALRLAYYCRGHAAFAERSGW